jgi:hypothetical protein
MLLAVLAGLPAAAGAAVMVTSSRGVPTSAQVRTVSTPGVPARRAP